MTEEFAYQYVKSRQQQLGAAGFDLDYKHLTLKPGQKQPLAAQGQMWIVIAADEGIRVQSDTGQYYPKSRTLQLHMHEHTGQLVVQNNERVPQQVRFVVATWRYPGPTAAPTPPVKPAG